VDDDVQPTDEISDPSAELLAVARRVTGPWLRRTVDEAARRGGFDPTGWDDLDPVVDAAVGSILVRLEALLATDVDEQRTNPLSIFRDGVDAPTRYLAGRGVPGPDVDAFAAQHFPSDPYGLGPAGWDDIDAELRVPGLTWGAWKAMTVLRRRRDEGLR